jgi:hypothetical protein
MSSPPTNFAGEPLDPSVDLVRVATRGVTVALLRGIGCSALVLALVRMLLARAAPSDIPDTGAVFFVLVLGVLGAMLLAAATAWHRLAPITSGYRRGGLSLVSAFGTFLGALVATPIHYFFGQPGLIGVGLVCVAASLVLGRSRR